MMTSTCPPAHLLPVTMVMEHGKCPLFVEMRDGVITRWWVMLWTDWTCPTFVSMPPLPHPPPHINAKNKATIKLWTEWTKLKGTEPLAIVLGKCLPKRWSLGSSGWRPWYRFSMKVLLQLRHDLGLLIQLSVTNFNFLLYNFLSTFFFLLSMILSMPNQLTVKISSCKKIKEFF